MAASVSRGFDLWGILFTRILPWTVALAAIVLVVMKLMGVDIDSLIRKKAVSPTVIFEENAGDIDPGDFEQRLETALEQRNLRQRSEEHTSELQLLMHTSYAVTCLKKK